MAYDRNNIFARILRGEIPCNKVFEDPHVATRRLMIDVPDPVLGSVKLVGPVAKLSSDTDPVARAAPLLGEHNEEILSELLGYTDEDVARLKADGVI